MANELLVGPGGFPSITAALAAANQFDTIRVAPGTYNEVVVITKTVQLLGAQAGVDARTRQTSSESIVTSIDNTGVIQIMADNVVVDGFTVQGNTAGPGIHTFPTNSGYWIFNNIIQNNSYGLFLNTVPDPTLSTTTQVRQNVFFANDIFGNAIYSQDGASNVFIESNQFNGQHNSASINFASPTPNNQIGIIISRNAMVNDNSIALTNTQAVKVTENSLLNTQGSSIFFGGGTDRTEIEGNILHNSVSNGISVTNFFSGTPNTNIRAKDNSIQGNQNAGLNIEPDAYIVAPRRLDATNNWWGSPSGPSGTGPGTGDRVIDPDGVAEIVPFLLSDPLAAPTCVELLAACQANAASLQSQLNASQSALAATQAELAACEANAASLQSQLNTCQSALIAAQTMAGTFVPRRSLRKIQLKLLTKQKELADHFIRTKKGKRLAIRTLTASIVEVREAKHFFRTRRLSKAQKELNDTLFLIRRSLRAIQRIKA
jgi:hypothetical protein